MYNIKIGVLHNKFSLNYAGPVNNILVVRQQLYSNFHINPNMSTSSKRHGSLLPPPLEKYANSTDEVTDFKAVIGLQATCSESMDSVYHSSHVMNNQIKELQVYIASFIVLPPPVLICIHLEHIILILQMILTISFVLVFLLNDFYPLNA